MIFIDGEDDGFRKSLRAGAQAEIVLRELGGFLWLQIMAAVVFVRGVCWLLGVAWRRSWH